jgi:hypothetical protein
MRIHTTPTLLLFCLCGILLGCDSGPSGGDSLPEDVTVQGNVTLPNGAPADSATVEVYPSDESASSLASDVTDSSGEYELLFEPEPGISKSLRLKVDLETTESYQDEVELSAVINRDVQLSAILINTIEQLQEIDVDGPLPLDGFYKLANDIDASATADWNNGRGFDPIGNYDGDPEGTGSTFAGSFNGNGHSIQALTINRETDGVALFALAHGQIQNLELQNVNISGDVHTSALVGYNYRASVREISVSGKVTGQGGVGGVIGRNRLADVRRLSSSANINAEISAGGVVGSNRAGISKSSATGSVETVDGYAGGLVGNNEGTIDSSYATGAVSGGVSGGNFVGGLVGSNSEQSTDSSTVRASYATGTVSGDRAVGGLIGNGGTARRSYARGDVSGNEAVGGLGGSAVEVYESYSTGNVSAEGEAGGLSGRGDTSNSYWDVLTTGQDSAVGVGSTGNSEGLETSEMTGAQAEENMSRFDFESDWETQDEGYPRLQWQSDME